MSYAISNENGDHLGFVLMAGGPKSGDCLIRSLPADAKVFDTPESKMLSSLQERGELHWHQVNEEFKITDSDGETLLVERGGRMIGSGFVFFVTALS